MIAKLGLISPITWSRCSTVFLLITDVFWGSYRWCKVLWSFVWTGLWFILRPERHRQRLWRGSQQAAVMTQQEPAHYKELHLQGLKHVFFFLVFHEMFDRNLHFKALRRLLVLDEKLKKKLPPLCCLLYVNLLSQHIPLLSSDKKNIGVLFSPCKAQPKATFYVFFLSLIYCIHSHALLSSTQAISTKKNSRPVTYM